MKQLLIETGIFSVNPETIKESLDINGSVIVSGLLQMAEVKNGNGRVYPLEVLKREAQKYLNGPIKERRSYGELDHPCFDSTHRILTSKGWKLVTDISEDEIVATLNTNNNNLEWQQITEYINDPYIGRMINIKSKSLNTTVTPNHKFWVTKNTNHLIKQFKRADELNKSDLIQKRSNYIGNNTEYIIIKNIKGELNIPTSLFVKFMAWWLSEGWVDKSKNSNNINISQPNKNPDKVIEIKKIFEEMTQLLGCSLNISSKKNGENNFQFSHGILNLYLSQFGLCYDKFIPQEIKSLDRDNIQLFLDCYLRGDGTKQKNQEVYYTTSKQMSLDISELINLTGYCSSISEKLLSYWMYLINGEWIKDFTYYANKSLYKDQIITEKKKHYTGKILYSVRRKFSDYYHLDNCKISEIDYNDKIYCVSVPNKTILVMDTDGNSYWSGNSESPVISFQNTSHWIRNIWWEDYKLYGEIEILNTPSGRILKELFAKGLTVGVSSRAMGSVKQLGEVIQVQDDLELICWDFVSTPSTPGAYMSPATTVPLAALPTINESLIVSHKLLKVNLLLSEILCNRSDFCGCEIKIK